MEFNYFALDVLDPELFELLPLLPEEEDELLDPPLLPLELEPDDDPLLEPEPDDRMPELLLRPELLLDREMPFEEDRLLLLGVAALFIAGRDLEVCDFVLGDE